MQKKSTLNLLCKLCFVIAICLCFALLAVACNPEQTKPSNPDDSNEFGEWIIQTPATCEAYGLKYRTNKKGDRQEEVIPATGHSYGDWVTTKEATVMEEGSKESVCSRCNDKKTQVISALVDGTAGLEYTYWESEDMYYITGSGDALEVKDLVIPTIYKGKTVIYVYKDSLNDMPNLETVKFADNSNFTYIYPNALKGCKKLKSVEIPSSITYLPATFATDCDALEAVNVAQDNESFCSVDGVVYTKDKTSLVFYPQAKAGKYTIPSTLASITYKDIFKTTHYPLATAYGITAFDVEAGNAKYAASAQGVLFDKDMEVIYAYPLANTAEELVINSEEFSDFASYSFANNKYLQTIKVVGGSGYKAINSYAFYNTAIKDMEFEGISTVSDFAIYSNDKLLNVTFHSGKTSKFGLHYYGMASNTALKKVVLPYVFDASYKNGVLCSDDPFWGCNKLEDITFEQGGECAFVSVNGAVFDKDMTVLLFVSHAKTSLTLPNTLKAINSTALKYNETLAFENVGGLKYYQNWLVGISDDEIKEVVVKEGTIGIAAKALSGLTLEKLSLPESLKFLGYRAVANTKPSEFTYHSNFEYIEGSAFAEFGYVGGTMDLGTPSYVGDSALGYTKFDTIKVGFKDNGNATVIDGKSSLGAFYQSKATKVMFGPYVKEIGVSACNKMNSLLEVFIASQDVCNDSINFTNTWRTHFKSVTKIKWIAQNVTLSEKALSTLTGNLSKFKLVEGETTTVDGITYVKYQR